MAHFFESHINNKLICYHHKFEKWYSNAVELDDGSYRREENERLRDFDNNVPRAYIPFSNALIDELCVIN
jgi:hypothetical protein